MEDVMNKIDEAGPEPGGNFLENLVEEPDYARIRGVSIRTCQRDRHLRTSPPYIKLGRRVFYRVEAIKNWLINHESSGVESRTPTFTSRSRQSRAGGRS
jgi:hypothetical protein